MGHYEEFLLSGFFGVIHWIKRIEIPAIKKARMKSMGMLPQLPQAGTSVGIPKRGNANEQKNPSSESSVR
ncbi:MAG: hypothetical protein HY457_02005 [Parcubacteria group bacterium]|nr:hypothetical protein [Parcubacteria group bacterium]